ncbi:DUF6232 family protein [Novosphingobium soli]|uniref:DUF6232 family protein n=1 Tax=Novosphingobium soli TaxID=574956 RepID=A0ABV6D1A2_9SPHN
MIYQQGNVSVDSNFARFGSKSYAIDKINSVDVRVETKQGCLWGALAVISVFCFFGAIGAGTIGAWVAFLFFAGLTVLAYMKRPKPVYHLMLATSSGEVQATNAGDREAIGELRAAIETAMTQRG